jgi:iron-sulfur cluster insertion protein
MPDPISTISAPQITMTESAAQKMLALFIAKGNPNLKLRIFIEGGGCSGFTYEFAYETEKREDDQNFKKEIKDAAGKLHMVEVVVDPMSFPFVQGSEIDYEENFQSSKFIIHNPNAQTKCGCGSSFSV